MIGRSVACRGSGSRAADSALAKLACPGSCPPLRSFPLQAPGASSPSAPASGQRTAGAVRGATESPASGGTPDGLGAAHQLRRAAERAGPRRAQGSRAPWVFCPRLRLITFFVASYLNVGHRRVAKLLFRSASCSARRRRRGRRARVHLAPQGELEAADEHYAELAGFVEALDPEDRKEFRGVLGDQGGAELGAGVLGALGPGGWGLVARTSTKTRDGTRTKTKTERSGEGSDDPVVPRVPGWTSRNQRRLWARWQVRGAGIARGSSCLSRLLSRIGLCQQESHRFPLVVQDCCVFLQVPKVVLV